jgi:hypothetical protein
VNSFLCEAGRRINAFQLRRRIPGFIPSNFAGAYHVLAALAANDILPGTLFCEWGSGFGVVTCLAAMLEFDASGIEIESDLVDAAEDLSADFGLAVEFMCGSFIPPDSEGIIADDANFAWLNTHQDRTLAVAPDDFDVFFFAYPWPDEEHVTANLFARHAGDGAVLVTYHGADEFRVRRKESN